MCPNAKSAMKNNLFSIKDHKMHPLQQKPVNKENKSNRLCWINSVLFIIELKIRFQIEEEAIE